MKIEQLHQQYPDLLPTDADETTARVVDDLHTVYATAPTPAHINAAVTRAIQQRAAEQQERALSRRCGWGRRQLRGAGALIALLLALVIGGGAYAISPILDRSLDRVQEHNAGFEYVRDNNLYHEVDLSRTIDGYTIHVQRVYADANRILVGYTLTGLEGQEFFNFWPRMATMITADGHELRGSNLDEPVMDGNNLGEVLSFDTLEGYVQPNIALRFMIKDVDVYGKADQATIDAGLRKPIGHVAGPFVFDLIVPVIAGRVAEVNQTVTVNNVPVTLERVVVTPSETRMYVHFHDVPGKPVQDWQWSGHPRLAVDDWASQQNEAEGGGYGDNPRWVFSNNYALFDKHGEWTLTIDKLFGHDPAKVAAMKEGDTIQGEFIEGPWVFKFVVP